MGLAAFLTGRLVYANGAPEQKIDGYPVEEVRVQLGYWRKDWVIHRALCDILESDLSDEVSISANELRKLLGLVQSQGLKNEDGSTYESEYTLSVLAAAIEWIEKTTDDEWRDATYWGSW